MTRVSSRLRVPALIAGLALVAGCLGNDPGGPIPPTRITKLQAFYCAVHNTSQCQVRGDSIPTGTLPPTNESFMVWVWHPGFNTTVWRLISPLDNGSPVQTVGQDSNALYFALNGAPAKKYTVRVQIIGIGNSVLAEDSLHWEYP
jgi:hypothetical protein